MNFMNSWGGCVLEIKRRKCFREGSGQILLTDEEIQKRRDRWIDSVEGHSRLWQGQLYKRGNGESLTQVFQEGEERNWNNEHKHWFRRILLKGMKDLKWSLKTEIKLRGFDFSLFNFLLSKVSGIMAYYRVSREGKTRDGRRKCDFQKKCPWMVRVNGKEFT